jgi:hypothetical protein
MYPVSLFASPFPHSKQQHSTYTCCLCEVHSFSKRKKCFQYKQILERGYTRDWLPEYSFVLRARAMVLMGVRTLSDKSGARQYCPRTQQTAADNYVYGMSGILKNNDSAHTNAKTETKNYVTPQVLVQLLSRSSKATMFHNCPPLVP